MYTRFENGCSGNSTQKLLTKYRTGTLYVICRPRLVRIGKNCALGLGYRPRPAASGRTQDLWLFPIRTSRPANNIYIYIVIVKASHLYKIMAEFCNLKVPMEGKMHLLCSRSLPHLPLTNIPSGGSRNNVHVLFITSCYRNWNKLQPDGPVGLQAYLMIYKLT